MEQEGNKKSRFKIAILVLAILLALSVCALAARYIYLAYSSGKVDGATVPDNIIGESNAETEEELFAADESEEADAIVEIRNEEEVMVNEPQARNAMALELYRENPSVNEKFTVSNMLPGDTEVRYFCVKAYHEDDITLYFSTEITDETNDLGAVLHIIVTDLTGGVTLCDDYFNSADGVEFSEIIPADSNGESISYYKIEVSLATSVGNEYQASLLKADFKWYVKDENDLSPEVGDSSNLALWFVLAAVPLFLIILTLLLSKKRKKEEGHHE